MTLEQMLDAGEAQARRRLIGTKEELAPLWVVQDAKGDLSVFVTPWQNPAAKRDILRAMKDIMRETKVEAYSFLSEAWSVALPHNIVTYKGPPPSEHPDRRECVTCHAVDRSGRKLFREWDLIRDESGKCVELRRPAEEPTDVVGWLDSLLDERKPS